LEHVHYCFAARREIPDDRRHQSAQQWSPGHVFAKRNEPHFVVPSQWDRRTRVRLFWIDYMYTVEILIPFARYAVCDQISACLLRRGIDEVARRRIVLVCKREWRLSPNNQIRPASRAPRDSFLRQRTNPLEISIEIVRVIRPCELDIWLHANNRHRCPQGGRSRELIRFRAQPRRRR